MRKARCWPACRCSPPAASPARFRAMPAARRTCAGAMRPYWRCGGSWESSCWRPRSGGGPDPRGVAAAALGFQQRGVGARQRLIFLAVVAAEFGHAAAPRQLLRHAGDELDTFRHVAAQALGQFLRAVERRVGKQNAEFVAAQAGNEVAVAQAGFQRIAELDDELVARLVAEGIVDLLEVVDIENQQAMGPAVLQGAEQLL